MSKHHLLLVDGMNLIRRVYEANPIADSVEKAEAAISSSWQSFGRAIREHDPSHCLWTFDHGGPTWRHLRYAEYKLDRKPMPEPLVAEIEVFKERIGNQGWATAAYPGVEAEDTIASAALLARTEEVDVTVLSTDKDVICLLEYGARVHDHFNRVARDEAYCLEKFGVPSHLLPEVLALAGDATDGVPGVEGVGVKTAAKLVRMYGSVEGVLAAAGAIAGKLGERLREQGDRARLSRVLVELDYAVFSNAEHRFDLDEMVLGSF